MTATAVRVSDAVKTYGSGDAAVTALKGVTADFAAGAFTAIYPARKAARLNVLEAIASE